MPGRVAGQVPGQCESTRAKGEATLLEPASGGASVEKRSGTGETRVWWREALQFANCRQRFLPPSATDAP